MNVLTAFGVRLMAAMENNLVVKLLLLAVCADMVFGSGRAIKERHWNSSVGIDGAIRKAGMVASIVLFSMMDMVLSVDLLGWLPVTAKDFMSSLGLVKAGVTELFGILYVLYELTSVLKNMMLCGLPVPAGIRQKIGSWLEIMTDETKASLTPKHGKLSIPVHMDPGDLEDFSDEDLLDLAKQMGYELQEPFTREELVEKICSETVYV